MDVGCFVTVAMAPGSSLYCSDPEPAGGEGCGVSGVAEERETKLKEGLTNLTAPNLSSVCRVQMSAQQSMFAVELARYAGMV